MLRIRDGQAGWKESGNTCEARRGSQVSRGVGTSREWREGRAARPGSSECVGKVGACAGAGRGRHTSAPDCGRGYTDDTELHTFIPSMSAAWF